MADTTAPVPPSTSSEAPAQATSSPTIPPGFKLHVENTAQILLPDTADAFLNPVQEFNRDLSVACIRTWSEDMNAKRKAAWEAKLLARKEREGSDKGKAKAKRAVDDVDETEEPESKKVKINESSSSEPANSMDVDDAPASATAVDPPPEKAEPTLKSEEFRPSKITILEALSATGLRSIRYAKEIPLVKYVIANDLSPAATAAMRRNVELNGLGPSTADPSPSGGGDLGKVRINEGDACDLMYSHRPERLRVDVVDLDPYGTAAPFIDAAVQSIKDDGLLCVTCTDMTVLASGNYPEKCFSNYGGIPAKTEYCHESALRLVLHTLSTSAARYGRFITPLLSLSIDFYVRLFVKVRTAPVEVKKAMTKTAIYHVCQSCQAFTEEPLGRIVERKKGDTVTPLYKTAPSAPISDTCVECGGKLHVAGPMWSGPIHDPTFVKKVLEHVNENSSNYGTHARMKGMLTVASEELDTPFYFTPAKVASHFHCECPSLDDTASAILNGGYKISRSHACAGSLKSDAPQAFIHDLMRTWILDHPVRMDKIKDEASKTLLNKPIGTKADFTRHAGLEAISNKIKLVRYQVNPQPNWGPGARPDSKKKSKSSAAAE
ncbi:RNA methyltransferase tRNA(m5U54)methyltransferase [Tulasnella sp. 408]|nr:RNA methyltransferase tRNA(m5U54)methyltransferase [Tulasnella sp. 408]